MFYVVMVDLAYFLILRVRDYQANPHVDALLHSAEPDNVVDASLATQDRTESVYQLGSLVAFGAVAAMVWAMSCVYALVSKLINRNVPTPRELRKRTQQHRDVERKAIRVMSKPQRKAYNQRKKMVRRAFDQETLQLEKDDWSGLWIYTERQLALIYTSRYLAATNVIFSVIMLYLTEIALVPEYYTSEAVINMSLDRPDLVFIKAALFCAMAIAVDNASRFSVRALFRFRSPEQMLTATEVPTALLAPRTKQRMQKIAKLMTLTPTMISLSSIFMLVALCRMVLSQTNAAVWGFYVFVFKVVDLFNEAGRYYSQANVPIADAYIGQSRLVVQKLFEKTLYSHLVVGVTDDDNFLRIYSPKGKPHLSRYEQFFLKSVLVGVGLSSHSATILDNAGGIIIPPVYLHEVFLRQSIGVTMINTIMACKTFMLDLLSCLSAACVQIKFIDSVPTILFLDSHELESAKQKALTDALNCYGRTKSTPDGLRFFPDVAKFDKNKLGKAVADIYQQAHQQRADKAQGTLAKLLAYRSASKTGQSSDQEQASQYEQSAPPPQRKPKRWHRHGVAAMAKNVLGESKTEDIVWLNATYPKVTANASSERYYQPHNNSHMYLTWEVHCGGDVPLSAVDEQIFLDKLSGGFFLRSARNNQGTCLVRTGPDLVKFKIGANKEILGERVCYSESGRHELFALRCVIDHRPDRMAKAYSRRSNRMR